MSGLGGGVVIVVPGCEWCSAGEKGVGEAGNGAGVRGGRVGSCLGNAGSMGQGMRAAS